MIDFDLAGHEYIELHSLLKVTGLCGSGGSAKQLIAEGLVRVDGEPELRKRRKLRAGQQVEFAGQLIAIR